MDLNFWKSGIARFILVPVSLGVFTGMKIEQPFSDSELIKKLPGFSNHYDTVNGTRLHYAEGGEGKTIILLPGWPETWYAYHLVAPALAEHYHVLILDIRGMGTSAKPSSGYDKKTMAADIHALMQKKGIGKAYICGHDIGAMVAFSFAANYPDATEKLILMEGSHPNPGIEKMPMLPAEGTFTEKMSGKAPYAWWFAFNQAKELPEKLLARRSRFLIDWIFEYVSVHPAALTDFDRSVYAAAYDQADNIRAGNAWYQAFGQDIKDSKTYPKLTMPVLGIGSYIGYGSLKMGLPEQAVSFKLLLVKDSGHFVMEEKPKVISDAIIDFLK